jgi:hypothetical protein
MIGPMICTRGADDVAASLPAEVQKTTPSDESPTAEAEITKVWHN